MIFVLQWVIVTFLNVFFKLYAFGGLTVQHWLISVFIGATCLLVSQVLRWLPFGKPQDTETTEVLEEELQIRYHEASK